MCSRQRLEIDDFEQILVRADHRDAPMIMSASVCDNTGEASETVVPQRNFAGQHDPAQGHRVSIGAAG